MAACTLRRFLKFSRITQMQHRTISVYTETHGFHEDALKKKLSQFSGGSVDLSLDDSGIGVLTLNNPSRMNAFTGTMMVELLDRVKELEDWKDGKGLIVRGAGNTFCSGSDLKAVKAISSSHASMKMCMYMQNTLTRLSRLPLISVALVQGKALGGGAELSTACDFRSGGMELSSRVLHNFPIKRGLNIAIKLMTPESEIRFVHKHMGLVPGWGGAARLVHIIGGRCSLQLLSSAHKVNPEQALGMGLIDAILSSGDRPLDETHKWLSQFTEGPVEVIQAIKKVVVSGREQQLEAALRTEKDIFGTVWGGPSNLQALSQGTKHK
ncbi:ethylmalonyl-CoA decarboxylase isoform X1 [Pleurodeles waltl]|uniref:ethylmalonyl-CoA decarboxylase isoform X1 n=1 Tax=Pleurodeles waltl TaxID=8319 RepID=UPI0037099E4E